MGERRVAGILNQKTLGEEPTVAAREPPPAEPSPAPAPDPTPRPVVYEPVAPSSTALHERQLRWLRERDRRSAAMKDSAGPPKG
jgi:hypothetical protein